MRATRVRTVLALPTAALLAASLGAVGCLENRCLLRYCDGPDCACSVASCGDGAAWDETARQCRCLPGRELLSGRCVAPEVAAAACGVGYRFANGGCFPAAVCRPGDELDRASGMCIPHERVNQVAQNMGVNVGVGQRLGCPPGQKLVIEGNEVACVPLAQSCAPDEVFDGTACAKPRRSCGEGALWDDTQGRCVPLAVPPKPAERVATIDLRPWSDAHFGPDGGVGAPAFCNAFARKPWSFGVAAGSSSVIKVTVSMKFPEAAIARGAVTTSSSFALSGLAVLPRAESEVLASARAVFAPLAASGGRAAASDLTTTVKCTIVNAARPLAVPATGGL